MIQYPIGPIVNHKALMTQAADVFSFLLLLFSSYPAALLQRQFHAQVVRMLAERACKLQRGETINSLQQPNFL